MLQSLHALACLDDATPQQFMDEVREALRPYVVELRRIYKLYEMLAAGPGGGVGSGISQSEFARFAKDAGLMIGPGRVIRRVMCAANAFSEACCPVAWRGRSLRWLLCKG